MVHVTAAIYRHLKISRNQAIIGRCEYDETMMKMNVLFLMTKCFMRNQVLFFILMKEITEIMATVQYALLARFSNKNNRRVI